MHFADELPITRKVMRSFAQNVDAMKSELTIWALNILSYGFGGTAYGATLLFAKLITASLSMYWMKLRIRRVNQRKVLFKEVLDDVERLYN